MQYWIKQGNGQYGPYSLGGLQHYLHSGNLTTDDLARSEGMDAWVPLSQVLGNIPVPSMVAPAAATTWSPQSTVGTTNQVDLPPNLPWWLLLNLEICTLGLLEPVWSIVLANWARKLSSRSSALLLFCLYAPVVLAEWYFRIEGPTEEVSILLLFGTVLRLVATFRIRDDMEYYYNRVERIGLTMSGVMVFFFGIVYLQYHVNSIYGIKKMLVRT